LRPDCFGRNLWLFIVGAALAVGGICLAIFRPGPVAVFLVPLPMTYAAALSGSCFWFRAKNTAGRERLFWQLWAGGCWVSTLVGLFTFFFLAKSLHSNLEFFGLAFTFLPQVLFMAALVTQPEKSEGQLRDPVVRYEAALVVLWWTYLYALTISPWHWVLPDIHKYLLSFARLHDFQNAFIVLWLMALWLVTRGSWRRAYGHLTAAVALLGLSTVFFHRRWNSDRWLQAMIFQALIAGAFLWLSRGAQIATVDPPDEAFRKPEPTLGAGAWLASITAVGIPLLTIWASFFSAAPQPVIRFRLFVSFATLIAAALLLYRWQEVAEAQRDRLVENLETSVRELRQLQGHFAEAEKLASLGQLAAGAAHEINNPVAAILGYSELLRSDPSGSARVHEFGRKIGDQTRRIRNLVQNLLSLTEHGGRETEIVDVSTPLRGALELRRISAGPHRQSNLSLVTGQDSFPVRGDREQLLQVFYRLLLALSEGGGEGGVKVRLRNENDSARVIVEFIGEPDTASSCAAAPEVYNARRAQQGRELSLGVCYEIVKEHGGAIVRETLLDGARIFRVELPAAAASQPAPAALV